MTKTTRSSNYLDVNGFSGFVLDILNDINASYQHNILIAVEILSRKLIEKMVINILIKNPGPDYVWTDQKANIIKNLHSLLMAFWEKLDSDFKKYVTNVNHKTLKELKDVSWEIKKWGDYSAHNVARKIMEKELEQKRPMFQNLINFLKELEGRIPIEHQTIESSDTNNEMEKEDEKKGISWGLKSCPAYFPDRTDWILRNGKIIAFHLSFRVKNLDKNALKFSFYIASRDQLVAFASDRTKKKINWKKLRFESKNIFLDASETECLMPNEESMFYFNGYYRPKYLANKFTNQVIIDYWIKAETYNTNKNYSYFTGNKRIQIPIGKPPEIKSSVKTDPPVDDKDKKDGNKTHSE